MKTMTWTQKTVMTVVFSLLLGIWASLPDQVKAQSGQQAVGVPKFKVDPFWPKPLPDRWVTGDVSGVCVDAQDHVFTVNRMNLTDRERKVATASPAVLEFDQEGNLVNSWGTPETVPGSPHGCFVDYQGNLWIAGNKDGIVQKYSHDGKLLLQIGTKGQLDTSDGTITGAPMNSSHTSFNNPSDIAVDPTNGDIYVSDGYDNRRVAVFDRDGRFLRQWGRQGTLAEVDGGVGGVFLKVVHCVVIGNDGLVYVCDRLGNRVEVFDKMGNLKRNIFVESKTARLVGIGSACWVAFSPDPTQKFMYVGDCADGEVRTLDRASGQALSSFGRPGHQAGDIMSAHSIAVDSKGDIIVGEVEVGRRVQMFRLIK